MKYLFIFLSIFLLSCYGASSINILGCTDVNAINYNVDATEDDGSCEYSSVICTICGSYCCSNCGTIYCCCGTSCGKEDSNE